MDLNTKTAKSVIKILFIEQLVIGGVLLVLGFLRMFDVIKNNGTRLLIYNIITMGGGLWFVFDLVWSLCSEKRRKKVSMFDKITPAPVSLYLIGFDIYCFVTYGHTDGDFVRYSVASVLLAASIIMFLQAFYHRKNPAPMTIAAIIEAEQEEAKEKEELEAKEAQEQQEKTEEDKQE